MCGGEGGGGATCSYSACLTHAFRAFYFANFPLPPGELGVLRHLHTLKFTNASNNACNTNKFILTTVLKAKHGHQENVIFIIQARIFKRSISFYEQYDLGLYKIYMNVSTSEKLILFILFYRILFYIFYLVFYCTDTLLFPQEQQII